MARPLQFDEMKLQEFLWNTGYMIAITARQTPPMGTEFAIEVLDDTGESFGEAAGADIDDAILDAVTAAGGDIESHLAANTRQRPPPPPSSKPFDPSAPREHYAKSHHFAVNDLADNRRWSREYIDALPDSAFLFVDKRTGERHLPYRDAHGGVDYAHLKNALARIDVTDISETAKEDVRRRAERIFHEQFPPTHIAHAGRRRFPAAR
jgi:hypothetical protein